MAVYRQHIGTFSHSVRGSPGITNDGSSRPLSIKQLSNRLIVLNLQLSPFLYIRYTIPLFIFYCIAFIIIYTYGYIIYIIHCGIIWCYTICYIVVDTTLCDIICYILLMRLYDMRYYVILYAILSNVVFNTTLRGFVCSSLAKVTIIYSKNFSKLFYINT